MIDVVTDVLNSILGDIRYKHDNPLGPWTVTERLKGLTPDQMDIICQELSYLGYYSVALYERIDQESIADIHTFHVFDPGRVCCISSGGRLC